MWFFVIHGEFYILYDIHKIGFETIAKLSPSPNPTQLGAELVIFPINPATQPPTHPTYQKSSFQA